MSLLADAAARTWFAMASPPPSFQMLHPAVNDILGESPTLEVLLEKDYPFAHEAGVFVPSDDGDTLYVTSNFIEDPQTKEKKTQISRVVLPKDGSEVRAEEINPSGVPPPNPNGGVNYRGGIVFCAQENNSTSGGLAIMQLKPPYNSEMLVDKFVSRPFNSANDVVAHTDESLWFTDPFYGSEQGIRPPPKLPQQVYRFDPRTNSTRVMADGFGRPNGIAFNPSQQIVYVTDTDATHGDGSKDDSRASTM